MTEKVALTIVVPTLNEHVLLAGLLHDLDWADEIIVADGGSTDGTVALAQRHGAAVVECTGRTIAAQRNAAIERARNQWILALDADERVPVELRDELREVLAGPVHSAYRVRRRNFFLGRERRRGHWGRDWQVRLFTRDRRFLDQHVHERLEPVPDTGALRTCLLHTPYRDLQHHLDKMTAYAHWGAQELYARGRRADWWELGFRPGWRFIYDYLGYGSCLDGTFGLLTSVLTAYSCFLKYAYLWELSGRDAAHLAPKSG